MGIALGSMLKAASTTVATLIASNSSVSAGKTTLSPYDALAVHWQDIEKNLWKFLMYRNCVYHHIHYCV